jgi:hypothetical protein
MIEKDYWVFEWNGSRLRATGQRVKMNGGPVAIRTADKSRSRVERRQPRDWRRG